MKDYVPPPGSIPTLSVPDLAGLRRPHLVGIGGAGMSGIARLLMDRGLSVTGCDLKEGPGLASLRGEGSEVDIGHDPAHLGRADAVVVSTAIPASNPEIQAARDRGIPVLIRAQVLAALMAEHRGVAVAGTHGKTTTTSMIAVVLEKSGLDPTYVIGGELNESGSNARSGKGDVFVAEADESDGSFLLLRPELAVVTNVEADHLDFFADAAEVESAFAAFCRRAGRVVACGDDPGVGRAVDLTAAITYGEGEENDVHLEVVAGDGAAAGVVAVDGARVEVRLPVPGRHLLLNATAAIAIAAALGVDPEEAARALDGFGGVRRRFEHVGGAGGATFVDDYAHHPTEIEATLAAARGYRARRLVAVFQPHRFSRTAAMGRALGESLAGADVVVLTDVYGAGEPPLPGVTGKVVLEGLAEAAPGKRILYLPRRVDVAAHLAAEVREGDLVLTMGAGDVTMVGDETMAVLRERDGG
jgi:UDP-N-acetylmuramate--alanine ligase